MKSNGEAIYGSKVWRSCGEGPTKTVEGQFAEGNQAEYTPEDIRFTAGNGCIYAFVLKWPEDGRVTIKSLAEAAPGNTPVFSGIIRDVRALGFDTEPDVTRDADGLHISAPAIASDYPVTFRISVN